MSQDNGDIPAIVPVKEFEEKADCPKCPAGHEDLEFIYCSGPAKGSLCGELPSKYEHLHVHCCTCGYSFLMDTRDAEDRKKAAEEAAAEKIAEEATPEVGFSEGA